MRRRGSPGFVTRCGVGHRGVADRKVTGNHATGLAANGLAAAGLAVAWLVGAATVQAQQVRTGLVPDTATVGDVVRVVVQVGGLMAGARVELPDTLAVSGTLENAARLRTREDSANGAARVTAIYSVTPWWPGAVALPELTGRVVDPGGGSRPLSVSLPALPVRSVLPADTAGVKPKPPRGVLGPSRLWWPPVLVIVGILMVLTGFYWWWRRRRTGPAPAVEIQLTPRQRALAALDRAYGLGLMDRGEAKVFYSLVTEAVRTYLAELDGRWGEDLTTHEVLAHMGRSAWSADVRELGELLEAADLVKFARRRPAASEAEAEWARIRTWVVRFGSPAPTPEQAA
jgi:hypothetical protein